MVRYSKYFGLYDVETKTFTTFGTGNYTPDQDGHLVGLRIMIGAAAVTTLTEHVQFRLTSASFKPESLEIGACGIGLATAPRQGFTAVDWPCDQMVKAGVAVKLEGRNLTADTPVGVEVYLYGLFD
mgnify:CR=1 FL=1